MNPGNTPQWLAELRAARGAPAAPARTAPDAVNLPMIRRWCEAMGERNPLYLDESYAATSEYGGVVAPPAMLEVWTMGRFRADGSTDTGQLLGMDRLNAAGFTAVVATNLEQDYLRYLRPGDLITQRVFLEEVSDEKRTALGAGHFLDYRYEFSDQRGELVGRMRFRILKFRPTQQAVPASAPPSQARPSTALGHARQRLLLGGAAAAHAPHSPLQPLWASAPSPRPRVPAMPLARVDCPSR